MITEAVTYGRAGVEYVDEPNSPVTGGDRKAA